MFKGAQANPYDDVVVKATDETLTSENWELILNLCDKVQDEGEQGARNVIAALLKRLSHRNPNVQLYSLVLAESLSKNCGKEVHSEIASRAFTQALERLITDRTTHDKVRRRILMLIAMWTEDFESDPTLGIMEECYESLKAKNYKYEANEEPPPPDDDEARKREEEELQRVLELSIQDKGGRKNWGEYSLASSSGAGGSGSASTAHQLAATPASTSSTQGPQPPYSSGYVPSTEAHSQAAPAAEPSPPSLPSPAVSLSTSATPSTEVYGVTRVRALHGFEPTESNELAFEKGDIIKVVNREYKDWWRGQLRGRTGIFPVNYVEPLPEPTVAELAAEAQQESSVFAQAANVDRLLTILRTLDPAKDNLADNEEIQELYRSCMTLRPKIVKLIDKYSQKRADLVSMNESFVRARTIFDRMMEESLARHSEYYEQQRPVYAQPQSTIPRTDSRAQGQQPIGFGRPTDPQQSYGWNQSIYDQPGYNPFPTPAAGYPLPHSPNVDPRVGLARNSSYGAPQPQSQPQPQLQIQTQSQPVQQAPQPQPQPQTAYVQPYPAPDNQRGAYYQQQPPQQTEPPSRQTITQTQSTGQPQGQAQHHAQLQHAQSQVSIQVQPQTQSVVPQQQQQQQQPQPQPQPQMQTQPQTQLAETQPHPHAQAQTQQQTMTGPPFVYDPGATYPDQNVQAWAQYYAQGGTDPTGSVYFVSVPGITDARSSPTAAVHPHPQGQQVEEQRQQQQQQQQQPALGTSSSSSSSPRLQRQSSLPNPYATNVSEFGEPVTPASAGAAPGAGNNAPWQSLPGQFTQMRVGEPSVGA